MVVTDHFTHYTQAYVTQSQTALTTAQGPLGQLYCSLWTVQEDPLGPGRNFESELIADLL